MQMTKTGFSYFGVRRPEHVRSDLEAMRSEGSTQVLHTWSFAWRDAFPKSSLKVGAPGTNHWRRVKLLPDGRLLAIFEGRGMVLLEAVGVALAGVVVGGSAVIVAGHSMRSLLFGTAPADPLVIVSSSMLMLCIAALATALPAREASKADPSVLLRAE